MGICDPVEPTYNNWHRGATIFGKSRCLFSHIHGVETKYILGTDEEYAELRRELVVELNKRLNELSTGWAAEKDVLTDEAVALYVGAEEESETRVEIEGIARKNRQLTKFRQLVRDAQALERAEERDELKRNEEAAMKAGFARTGFRETIICDDMDQALGQIDDIAAAIGKSNILFNYAGRLAEVAVRATELGKAIEHDDAGCRVDGERSTVTTARPVLVSPSALPYFMRQRHQYALTSKYGLKGIAAPRALVGALYEQGPKHTKTLTGVVDYPVWWRGALLQGSGRYHEGTGLYLNTSGVEIDDGLFQCAREAYQWLRNNLLADFPFKSEEDAVKLLAMALSLMVAPETLHEPGPPLIVITANRQNLGKTLAAEIMAGVVLGRSVTMVPWVSDRDEMTKVLATLVREAAPVQIFDNMPRGWKVNNAQIDGYITAVQHGGRLLGANQSISGPANAVICITGNRLLVADDSRSRTLEIELFFDTDRNQTDREFKHPNLPEFARRNREKILSAFACILQEGADHPWSRDKLLLSGRFPVWSQAVAWPLWLVSGLNITERWAEVGREAEDEGTAEVLPRVFRTLFCKAAARTDPVELGGAWFTGREAFDWVGRANQAELGIRENQLHPSKRMAEILKTFADERHGDFRLEVGQQNLGKRTNHSTRLVFRLSYLGKGCPPAEKDLGAALRGAMEVGRLRGSEDDEE
ncbi:MAG: hypothetical protein ACC645_20570 [Pirellulales bacterium]